MRRIFEAVYQVFFDKKWGILIKMEFESLIFTGLEIPRDYMIEKEYQHGKDLCGKNKSYHKSDRV